MLDDLKTRGWPDGEIVLNPEVKQLPHWSEEIRRKWQKVGRHAVECALEVNGRKYTERQLEHFGDAVLSLAVREMLHEKAGLNQRLYFMYSCLITSNKNLGWTKQTAQEAEIEIGRAYAINGFEYSMAAARQIVERTAEWGNFLRAIEEPPPHPA